VGSTQQFTATGSYSDSSSADITNSVAWSSSNTGFATIDATNGLATGVAAGLTIITATSDTISGNTDLTVTNPPPGGSTSISSIDYTTEGGKNKDKHLFITIQIVDDLGNKVSGASVSIDLFRDGKFVGSGTGTTDINGNIAFSLKNASPGLYTTTVTDVTAADLKWDGVTPFNEFPK